MKILGIGVDIIENKRIKSLLKNKIFVKRTFTTSEIKGSLKKTNKASYFAKKFAAKEAIAKSIGTGFRNSLNFKDIEILNDTMGKPYYKKTTKTNRIITNKFKVKNYNLSLSISDEKDYSIAFAILQKI